MGDSHVRLLSYKHMGRLMHINIEGRRVRIGGKGDKMSDKAKCRGCNRELDGEAYYKGGSAYHPETRERCPSNFYGGFVCSRACDEQSSLELERSMPGHGASQTRLGSFAQKSLTANWQ